MRKIFTVLLILLMLSTPTRFASASGGDGGGGIVDLNTISSFARPEVFTVILLTSFFIASTVFSPSTSVLPPAQRTKATLIITATLTLQFFMYVMREFAAYFLYILNISNFFFEVETASDALASPEQAQKGLWSAANANVVSNATSVEEDKEKQEVINRAVQAALRDPEVAQNYLDYATPEVKAAVTRALENQAADRARF